MPLPITKPSALVGGIQTSPSGQAGVGGAASCVSAAVATGAAARGGGELAAGGGRAGGRAMATGAPVGDGDGAGEAAHARQRTTGTRSSERIAPRSDNVQAGGGNFVVATAPEDGLLSL
jgi:hypothetical protein